MLLTPHPYVHSDQLTWVPQSRNFVAEMSDIGGFGRVYDDSADVGLTLVSRYPGHDDMVFVVDHEKRDSEGEVLYWKLKPVNPSQQRKTGHFNITVFND